MRWIGLLLAAVTATTAPQFVDVTQRAGIRFVHTNGASEEKHIVEIMGSGAAFLDFDNDGWLDLFVVNSNPVRRGKSTPATSRLYRNRGDGTFVDVTEKAGLRTESLGMGVAVGDFDNDGWDDLYVTNWGANTLYHNNGDGTFRDVTGRAGVAVGSWSTSAGWADYDGDGLLDLFVCNYLTYRPEDNRRCGRDQPGYRAYCTPEAYKGASNTLFHNNGDGTFSDVTRRAGVYDPDGKSLGVVWGDYNNDGLIDILVANDTKPNFLYRNKGDGTFEEEGLTGGVAYSEQGKALSGMGVDWGDFDNDGLLDAVITNLDQQYYSLFRNRGGAFDSVGPQAGVAAPSLLFSGFGVGLHDFNNDGWLDLFGANGHVIDNIHLYRQNVTFAERKLLYWNQGDGTFEEAAAKSGAALMKPQVSRGAAFGDYDNDGDIDVFISNNGGAGTLLRNDGGNRGNWLELKLTGSKSNRDAIGARVTLEAGKLRQTREVKNSGSYASSSDLRVHFGLGTVSGPVKVAIRWPSGSEQTLRVEKVNRLVMAREP